MTQTIACSTKNKYPNIDMSIPSDLDKNIADLLTEFKNEVGSIIKKSLDSAQSKLFEYESNAQKNDILRSDTLNEISRNKITDEQKPLLIKDLKNKINYKDMSNEIESLKNRSEYDLFLNGINDIISPISIDYESFEIKMPKKFSELKIINVVFDYTIEINYFNNWHTKDNFKFTNKFNYSLTDSKDLVEWWENIVNNLVTEVWNQTDLTFITPEKLGITTDDKFISKNRNLFPNYINNEVFAKEVTQYFDKKLDSKNKIKSSFKNFKNIYSNVEWTKELNANSASTYDYKDGKTGQKTYDFIFRDTSSKIDKVIGNSNYSFEEGIYNYINSESEKWLINYKKDLDVQINKLSLNSNKTNSINKLGYIYLKGLQISFDDYTQELPTIKLFSSYSINKNENIYVNNKKIENSDLLRSIYNNVLSGVKSFKNTFGIRKSKFSYPLSAFTGSNPSLNKNIWDIAVNEIGFTDGKLFWWLYEEINNVLSLTHSLLKEQYNYLLKNGNQDNYKWNFGRKTYFTYGYRNTTDKKGFFLEAFVENPSLEGVPGGLAAGEKSVEIDYKLDFLNLIFNSYDGWRWQPAGSNVFQRNGTRLFERVT